MSVIIAFCGCAFARPESDGVEATLVGLRNDAGNGETRGIDVEDDRETRIEMTEDGRGGEQGLKLVEGFLHSNR